MPNTVRESLGKGFARSAKRNTLARKRPRVFRTTATLHTLTADIWEQSQTSPDQVTQVPPQVHPAWELERPTICHSLEESLSKKSDPLYLAMLAMEITKEQLGNHLQIFTDGSVLESGEVGCAFAIPDLKITRPYRLLTGTPLPLPPPYSKSALLALAKGGSKNRGELQAEILFLGHQLILKRTDVLLMWLPSHTGIRGNEMADKEAKKATKNGIVTELKPSLTEIKSQTRKAARKMREEALKQRCEFHG